MPRQTAGPLRRPGVHGLSLPGRSSAIPVPSAARRRHVTQRGLIALALTLVIARSAGGQGYRVRIDTRLQVVSFRGLTPDSIAAADTVPGPGGGPATPDGFAVLCGAGDAYCHFYRPGPILHGAP